MLDNWITLKTVEVRSKFVFIDLFHCACFDLSHQEKTQVEQKA